MKKTLAETLANPDLIAKAATGATAMVITENLYKFKSFSLEFAGFLLTWGALYGLCALAMGLLKPKGDRAE